MARDFNDTLLEESGDAVRMKIDAAVPHRIGHNSRATPLFRELPSSSVFPVEALGDMLGAAAIAVQATTRAPMGLCATAALSVATLAAQAYADIELPTGQTVPLSGYFFTVARSGERKTAADNRAMVPVKAYEDTLRERYRAEFARYERAAAAYDAQRKLILSPKRGFTYDKQKLELELLGSPPRPPIRPIVTVNDLTSEGLAKYLLTDGYPSVGIFTTEGGQLIGGHGFTAESKLRTAALLNRLWDNGSVERVRVGEASAASGKRLSMHVQIQDEIAAAFFADPILGKIGLLGRILATDPPSTQGTRNWRQPGDEHIAALARYESHLGRVFRTPLPLKLGTDNELAPRVLRMSGTARMRWIFFHDQIEIDLKPELGAYAPVAALANKLPEHAARIAGVLALMDDADIDEVSGDHIERAMLIVEYYATEAFRLHGVARIDPNLREADALHKRLQEKFGYAEFQVRQVLALNMPAIVTADKARALLAILRENAHVEQIERTGERGHSKTYFRLCRE